MIDAEHTEYSQIGLETTDKEGTSEQRKSDMGARNIFTSKQGSKQTKLKKNKILPRMVFKKEETL
jgi:hypothetical protein